MRIAQESDALNGRAVIIIALLTLAIAALGVIVAWQLVVTTRSAIPAPRGFQARRAGPPPAEMNGVEMSRFPNGGTDRVAPKGGASGAVDPPLTEGYGWTDQGRGLVYIPLERAKELYLSRPSHPVRTPSIPERGDRP